MTKKYYATTSLVIVESPAKCAKIQQYLGNNYKVIASYGHLRELSSLKDIDLNGDHLKLRFNIIDNKLKQKQVVNIRKAIQECDEVILASDSDREGEAIAWHICDLFGLDVSTCKRIVFNEITESAIKTAIANPRTIDMNLVYAQQARQIIDLVVGYKISPVLWNFVTCNAANSLSAGRCQTPALKIIYDNQQEIDNGEERTVYNTHGYFTKHNICFELNKQFETEAELKHFLTESDKCKHIYHSTPPKRVSKVPPAPFTTSRLQQVVSNELRYSPKDTMKLCQTLYEAGLITYMRTDSKCYSVDFVKTVEPYIIKHYGEGYFNNVTWHENNSQENHNKQDKNHNKQDNIKKDALCQEAHESIRPTNISLQPADITEKVSAKELKVYKIIWENTLESCMPDAVFHVIQSSINGACNTTFKKTNELIYFPGWKIVKKKYETENIEYQHLKTIKDETVLQYNKIVSKVAIVNKKSQYTEAGLIQSLEEKGIGRPSTYSMLVDKIQERNYVKKMDVKGKTVECKDFEFINGTIKESVSSREFGNEKNKLVIQPLGKVVMTFLDKHFNELFNYEHTKQMEEELDKITKNNADMYVLCKNYNVTIDNLISNLNSLKRVNYAIDENNSYIVGRYGPVMKCTEGENVVYKPVKNIDIQKLENGEYKLEDILEPKLEKEVQIPIGKFNDKDVFIKNGKFGIYAECDGKMKSLKELGKRDITTISLEEVIPYLKEEINLIRRISNDLSIRKGPKGDYLFYKTSKMKKPKFFAVLPFNKDTNEHYRTCDDTILKAWINKQYF